MDSGPLVGLIVLNWNRWDDLKACLSSMQALTYPTHRVYVVDNGSTDGSPHRVAAEFPDVRLIALPRNQGYGGGMNAGIRVALEERCRFVLCLNNDMTFDPSFLEPLVQAAGEEKTVPYPAIYRGDEPTLLDNAGNRVSYTGLTSLVAHGAPASPEAVEANYTEVPFLPRTLLERIGGYGESYFAFYEDVDLCLRLQDAGWTLRLVPESKVYHRRGTTTRRIPGFISYYGTRNRLLLMADRGTPARWLLTALHVILVTIPLQVIAALSNPASPHSPRHLLLGLRDGLLPWRRGLAREWPLPA